LRFSPSRLAHPFALRAASRRRSARVFGSIRLALLYALLDGQRHIQPPHLQAALALWDYAARSAAWALGQTTGDPLAEQLHAALIAAEHVSVALLNARSGTQSGWIAILEHLGWKQRTLDGIVLLRPGRIKRAAMYVRPVAPRFRHPDAWPYPAHAHLGLAAGASTPLPTRGQSRLSERQLARRR